VTGFRRPRDEFPKTPLSSVLTRFQKLANPQARFVLNIRRVLEFVGDDVENGELPVGLMLRTQRASATPAAREIFRDVMKFS
jgi:hypothetical protein